MSSSCLQSPFELTRTQGVCALVWVTNGHAHPAAVGELTAAVSSDQQQVADNPTILEPVRLVVLPAASSDRCPASVTETLLSLLFGFLNRIVGRSILRGRLWRCVSVHQRGRKSMSGEKDLAALLKNLSPALHDEEYVFVSLPGDYGDHAHLKPLCSFKEREGLGLIVPKVMAASHGLDTESVFRMITLEVHSSLDAVGLTAAVASKLSDEGISANVVAATYHDHVFVQSCQAERALQVLRDMGS